MEGNRFQRRRGGRLPELRQPILRSSVLVLRVCVDRLQVRVGSSKSLRSHPSGGGALRRLSPSRRGSGTRTSTERLPAWRSRRLRSDHRRGHRPSAAAPTRLDRMRRRRLVVVQLLDLLPLPQLLVVRPSDLGDRRLVLWLVAIGDASVAGGGVCSWWYGASSAAGAAAASSTAGVSSPPPPPSACRSSAVAEAKRTSSSTWKGDVDDKGTHPPSAAIRSRAQHGATRRASAAQAAFNSSLSSPATTFDPCATTRLSLMQIERATSTMHLSRVRRDEERRDQM